ncbi:MAG: flagellar biosynthetic protein FliO [Pseudomonadota bacterium]
MMVRFLLAVAVAAALAGGAAQARQAQVQPQTPAPAPQAPPAAAPAELPAASPPARAVVVQPMATVPAAGSLIQTILALCAVLGLLAVLAWFMKRYGPKAIAGSAHVRLVGALNLGGRERIMVVEVGDQWIVVGASPGRVNALATMPRQADAALAAQASLHPHQPPASSFAEWLKQTIDKRNAK